MTEIQKINAVHKIRPNIPDKQANDYYEQAKAKQEQLIKRYGEEYKSEGMFREILAEIMNTNIPIDSVLKG